MGASVAMCNEFARSKRLSANYCTYSYNVYIVYKLYITEIYHCRLRRVRRWTGVAAGVVKCVW